VGLTVNGTTLHGGDGAFLTTPKKGDGSLALVGASKSDAQSVEFLLFDIKKS